ncbi:PAS domain-containing protein [Methylobacterium sp. WL30]|uniref:sensor histidine kinase n=1 Tax=unclassified Methylobacterium TaxID=2615210 RepID=UPI0011CB8499|nr:MULTISPECIES: HWE histidine kinase domain-containing protein [unclassified Methylobacterium]TXN39058.1 PAS domain-containing protein [Methylobacterium sp. WL93]TXN47469.1 PAS domain-containing protein [Methylobacterium sp. WL119]TXN65264.1 PAS domain-containing protein [Methylobacterium sp. WL30]
MDTGASCKISAFQATVADRRLSALEAENHHLRALLSEASRQADAEAERNARLGRIVVSERGASRIEARRIVAEAVRMRAEAESTVEHCRRDLARGAARLAGAEELNAQLRASEEFNRRILWTTTDFVKVLDLDGRLITVSENGPAVLGVETFAGLVGRAWIDFWSAPDSRAGIRDALDAARAGRPCRFQAVLNAGAAPTWWDIAVTPIDGADGRPERILAVSRDITDLKRNEARQTLLMQELAHRVKNTLALVQAVATQTLRNAPSLEEAGRALDARLVALAQAHDVLVQGAWSSASLSGLVAGAVALHGDGVPGQFTVSGPDLTLAAGHGLTLALMLHELATNAAKYGALSTGAGRVAISWAIDETEPDARLRFRWEEIGGPPVAPPTRTGFGTRLIARCLSHDFGGAVALRFPPTGAVLTLEAPLASVVAA